MKITKEELEDARDLLVKYAKDWDRSLEESILVFAELINQLTNIDIPKDKLN